MATQDGDAFPGRELLLAAGFTGGPEELQQHLEQCLKDYQRDKSAGWPTLVAFALIAREAWSRVEGADEMQPDDLFNTIDPLAPVDVPWWAVQAIAIAWCRHSHEDRTTLDRAFGVNRPRRGVPSPREEADQKAQQIGYAREVAWELPQVGGKVWRAVEVVATRWKVAESTIWSAWSSYGEKAKRDAEAARTAQSGKPQKEERTPE